MLCTIREDYNGNILIDPVSQRKRAELIRAVSGQRYSVQLYRPSLVILAHHGETGNDCDFARIARKLKGKYRANVRIPEEHIRAWLGLP